MTSSRLTKNSVAGRFWMICLSVLLATVGVVQLAYLIWSTDVEEGEKDVSKSLMKAIDPKRIDADLEYLTSKVHRAGTPEAMRVAQFIHDSFVSYGLDKVEFEDYNVLLSHPNVTNPDKMELLDERGDVRTVISSGRSEILYGKEEDRSSNANIRFLGWSRAGSVNTTKLVYANYGTPDDFDYLVNEAKIDLKGSIVLMRTGISYRGSKVALAQRHGAAGAILYTDPADATYHNDTASHATFPDTVYMPATAVQRGNVANGGDGDILTPLLPAKDYVFRHDIREAYDANFLPSIPVTPIGYGDAQKLLESMDGPVAPDSWQGGLPLSYRIGPEIKAKQAVRLTVTTYPERRTIRNVIGYIRGSVEPDRYVILGNHHDSWVYGALDPSSGVSAMLETARAFAAVMNETGWRPRRTIMFCAWDGEEQFLIGSSEYVQQYLKRLETKTVAYINVDSALQEPYTLCVKTVPLLKRIIFNAASKVYNPDPKEAAAGRKTVYDTWRHRRPDDEDPSEPQTSLLDSGSDYRHIIFYAGIPSLGFRFSKTGTYPLYHTMHDTMRLVRLVDPALEYHRAVARLWGEMARDLADSVLIPFKTSDYGYAIQRLIRDLERSVQSSRAGSYANLRYVREAGRVFLDATISFDEKVSRMANGDLSDSVQLRMINDQLANLERMFIIPNGLPGTPFLRHAIFATSDLNGYAGETFPGIRDTLARLAEAVRSKSESHIRENMAVLNDQISWVAHCLHAAADLLMREF